MNVVRPPSISRRTVVSFSARRKYLWMNPGEPAGAPFIGGYCTRLLLDALDVTGFGGIDLDFVAVADERRHVDDQTGFELRGLHHRAGRRFLDALFGFDHGQIDGIG